MPIIQESLPGDRRSSTGSQNGSAETAPKISAAKGGVQRGGNVGQLDSATGLRTDFENSLHSFNFICSRHRSVC